MRNAILAGVIFVALISGATAADTFTTVTAMNIDARTSKGLVLRDDTPTTIMHLIDGGEIRVRLGDAAGAKYWYLSDSNGVDQVTIDSDGNLDTSGSIAVASGEKYLFDGISGNDYMILEAGQIRSYIGGVEAIRRGGSGAEFNYPNNGVSGPFLGFEHRAGGGTAAAGWQTGRLSFMAPDNVGGKSYYADIVGTILDPTNTSEDGYLYLGVTKAGTTALSSGIYEIILSPGAVSFASATVTIPEMYSGAATDMDIKLGDNVGANALILKDSADLQRGKWDSDGNFATSGTLVAGDANLDGAVTISGLITGSDDFELSGGISAEGGLLRVGAAYASNNGFETQTLPSWFNINLEDVDFTVSALATTHSLFVQGSDGYVGIGTTPTYRLDVAANHASGYAASFFNDGATSTRLGIKIQCGEDGSGGSILVDFYHGGGGLLGNISDNSGLGFDQLSDKKIKSNIRPSERDAVDKVRKLKWYAYDIDGRHIDGGLVAQRVEDILPDAVTTRTFTSATGTKSVMMIHGAPVEKVFQQALTQMAIEQDLQRRQIDYLKAQAIKAGWDMSSFPLQ